MTLAIPAQAWQWAQAGAGDLAPVILSVAYPESGFDPQAVGDGGCSKGWLQYYTCGGLGDGHSDAELFDPVWEARDMANRIRATLATGGTIYDALAPWSTRNQALALLPQIQGGDVFIVNVGGNADGSSVSYLPLGIAAAVALAVVFGAF